LGGSPGLFLIHRSDAPSHMPPRRLLATLAALGVLTGVLHLRLHSPRSGPAISGSVSGSSAAIRESGTEPFTNDVRVNSEQPGAATTSGEWDRGDHEAPGGGDPGLGLAAMAEALHSAPDFGQKGEWADRIAGVGGREAIELLVNLAVGEQDEESLRAILEAFKGLSDPQDLLLLASVVTATPDFRILEAATEMISRSATPEIVDYLVELSRQPPLQPTQGFAALWMIERIQNPEALRGLAKLANQAPEPDLARAAAVALARLGGPLAESVLTESTGYRHRDNPDLDPRVQNVGVHPSQEPDASTTPVSWAVLAAGSAP